MADAETGTIQYTPSSWAIQTTTPPKHRLTETKPLRRAEHASQQVVSWSFCGSYAFLFSYLASRHGSVAFPHHFGYVPPGVWAYHQAQTGGDQTAECCS